MTDDLRIILDSLPIVKIGSFPTPIEKLENICTAIGYEINCYIKRDDLTGVGPGGNKVRCLKYILGDALYEKKCDTIIVTGPIQSNLCTIVASACAKLNLESILVYNGHKPKVRKGNMLLNKLINANEIFLGEVTSEKRNKYANEIYSRLILGNKKPYVIENGASTVLGSLGYSDLILEILDQIKNKHINIKEIFIPGGNGGIAAGMIYGNYMMNIPFNINVISVEDDESTLSSNIHKIIDQIDSLFNTECIRSLKKSYKIIDDYKGEGWGKCTYESKKMVELFPQNEGIFIENIYNSKTIVGMIDVIKKNKIKDDACFVHTGGFGSLFGQY